MMIDKRLIGTVGESKKYIAGNVAAQWCSLAANIAMMTAITGLFACVPLIPVSIGGADLGKKLLSKYWGQYTALGDTFLKNLQF